jgi:hypothetical protein
MSEAFAKKNVAQTRRSLLSAAFFAWRAPSSSRGYGIYSLITADCGFSKRMPNETYSFETES